MSSPPNVFLFTLMGDTHTKFDMLADRQTDKQTQQTDTLITKSRSLPGGGK